MKAFWRARLDFVKQQMARGEQVPAVVRAWYEGKAGNYEALIDWDEKSVQAREGPVPLDQRLAARRCPSEERAIPSTALPARVSMNVSGAARDH